jgi:hypothetical protein
MEFIMRVNVKENKKKTGDVYRNYKKIPIFAIR